MPVTTSEKRLSDMGSHQPIQSKEIYKPLLYR